MNTKRRFFTALIMATFLEACQIQRRAPNDPRFIVALVDQSQTMTDFQEQQFADLTRIVASLGGGDTLQIYPVTENPLSTPDPISISLDPYNPKRFNPDAYRTYIGRETINQAKTALTQAKETIFDQDLTADTAIIDSLELASRAFHSAAARAAQHRQLVLLSDMWEDQHDRIRFPREKLTDKRIAQLLDQLSAEKRLPNLTGVEVWIAGARIHRDSPREFEDGVEAFSLAAFSRMGATATVERIAPSLRDFPTNPKLLQLLTQPAAPANSTAGEPVHAVIAAGR
jgi:hypothetical protein